MDDFKIKIGSQLDLENAKSQLQKFLSSHNKEKLKIDVELNNDLLKGLTREFETAGKNASSAFNKGFTLSKSPSIKQFTEVQKSILNQTKATEKEMNKILGNSVDGKIQANWADTYVKNQQKETQKALKEIRNTEKQFQKIQNEINSGSFDVRSKQNKAFLDKYNGQNSDSLTKLKNQIKEVDALQMKLTSGGLGKSDVISTYEKLNIEVEKLKNNMKEVSVETSKTLGVGVAERSSNKVTSYINDNTKALKKYETELRELEQSYKNITTQFEKNKLDSEFNNLKAKISAEGLTGKSWIDELSRGFKQIGQFAYTYGFIQEFPELIMRSVSELKEMDSILTEISKTSDLTSSQLKQLGKDSFDNASKYGKTANEYLLGVQEMSRSGFYGKKGEDMAELSILGQAAGDMSADVSNAYLLATNAAYGYQGSVEKLGAVLDGQNVITNRNSVAMLDMAEATTQAGSMAAQSGVKINELSALIGTAVARTKKSGSEVGTALKALFVNLQDTQNKKITGTFDSLGISMTKMVGDSELLKTPIELLGELSKVYNSLPDGSVEKANILKNIGGKHHANVLSAILSGQNDYQKMLKDYSEGMGSAAVEAEKSANNWQGSLNKLSNAWTSFISNFANSDLIIAGTNALTDFIEVLDTLVSHPFLAGSTVGAIGGGIAFFKNLD